MKKKTMMVNQAAPPQAGGKAATPDAVLATWISPDGDTIEETARGLRVIPKAQAAEAAKAKAEAAAAAVAAAPAAAKPITMQAVEHPAVREIEKELKNHPGLVAGINTATGEVGVVLMPIKPYYEK